MTTTKGYGLPFEGLKFCSTAVTGPLKPQIIHCVEQMGARLFSDLIADTDVLIVGDTDTEKYRFCVQRRFDIKFIRPQTVILLHEKWLCGANFDRSILDDYIMHPFDGLLICLSRLPHERSQSFQRNYITALIKQFSGTTSASLTLSTNVLVAHERSGKRYDKAIEWEIAVVHPQWILDCVRRGAILDYKYYDIHKLSDAEIGKNACLVWDQLIPNKKFKLIETQLIEKFESSHLSKPPVDASTTKEQEDTLNGLFSGLSFATYGFSEEQMDKLRLHITQNKGEIIDDTKSATHLLISSRISFRSIPIRLQKTISNEDLIIVNEWFIERSLFYHKVCSDDWSIPRPYTNLSLDLKISISGFCGVELLHITKLIELIGCQLSTTFQKSSHMLVVNLSTIGLTQQNSPKLFTYKYQDILKSPTPPNHSTKQTKLKINAAKKWSIPIVSLSYLWQTSIDGTLPNMLDYKWCIFGPRRAEPSKTFMEYARDITKGTFQTQAPEADDGQPLTEHYSKEGQVNRDTTPLPPSPPHNNVTEDAELNRSESESIKIPSPRKKKPKVWPRLVGTAGESQLSVRIRPPNAENCGSRARKRLVDMLDEDMEGTGTGIGTGRDVMISYDMNDTKR
ncbi:hypothetical protein CANARDRAFT_30525 [[Candida] arabinofermentans NRRL YB-2248]|uniref:BRCT domain-containing protein n=1 Tax=[Candida] arabinofermentans NRRL YB-2248 TaxID=983967 RepID=A0A1E4STQ4_9ASCO|nr:hypothetical protein CANARDRAFT_30525 [[Candida] arabinofermentans NRRL YB-2248]